MKSKENYLLKEFDYRFRCIEDYMIDHYETSMTCRCILRIMEAPDYFRYLFRKADHKNFASLDNMKDWYIRLWCRIKRHPCGSIYYNPGGYEPDPRCKNCGDEIG